MLVESATTDPSPSLDKPPDSIARSSHSSGSLYVPPGDVGYWQGAIREDDTDRGDAEALRDDRDRTGERLALFLRYADQDGGHDTVTASR